jgi:outer membrane receptor protein involved in Fe transport
MKLDHRRSGRRVRGPLALILAGTSVVTWAQQANNTPPAETPASDAAQAAPIPLPAASVPSTPGAETASQLSEVVVTATKRSEPVRNIPATMNVLKGEQLEREGVQDIDQIVARVPGVNMTDDGEGDAKRVTIRGVSSDLNTNFTTGTLLGDIPFSDPFVPKVQLDPNPFDMATVEVLKGPQGTLFGGSGLNGMIRYVPNAPEFDQARVKYYAQTTSYPGNGGEGLSYGGVINAPFADHTAAVRLLGFHRHDPGFIDNTFTGAKDINSISQYGFRGEAALHPADNWTLSLLGTRQHTRQNDVGFTTNFQGQLQRSDTPRSSPTESSYNLGNLGIQGNFSWATLVSQTSVFEKQFDAFVDASRIVPGGQVPVLDAVDHNKSHGLTQEIRLSSAPGDSPWKWLAGAFYYRTRLGDCAESGAAEDLPTLPPLTQLQGFLAVPCQGNQAKLAGSLDIAQLNANIKVQERALFGELTRELGRYVDVTVGARVYKTQTGGTVATNGVLYAAQSGSPTGAQHDADVAEHGLSPKGSIVFHPTRNLRAYVTASRGFRFGGPQIGASTPTTQVPQTYKSDSLWNYELGLRTDWLKRSLQVDASLYRFNWKNPQVSQLSNDGLVTFINNVGEAKGDGAELEIRYKPRFLHGLSLDSLGSWNRTVTTLPFDSATGAVVPSGSPWPLSPHWQASTTLAYTLPLETFELGASVRHTYAGKACNDIECQAYVFGYRTVDVNVFAGGLDNAWPQLSLSLQNLADERGVNNISINSTLGNTVNYIAPRAVVLRLSGNF